jgi:2-phosphoglycerate kinase
MLFLVSGASRSGKTLIAKKILANRQIPYLSLDWLMMGFNDGIPEYGIHHLLWPNEIAERMGPFLLGMIDSMLVDGIAYVIEGEAMLPQLVADLVEKNPDRIRAVFVGYTGIKVEDKVALVKKHSDGENDWLTSQSDEYIRDHIENMIAYSKTIKKGCEEHGLPYFDTSDDFSGAIEAAIDFLGGRDTNGRCT